MGLLLNNYVGFCVKHDDDIKEYPIIPLNEHEKAWLEYLCKLRKEAQDEDDRQNNEVKNE